MLDGRPLALLLALVLTACGDDTRGPAQEQQQDDDAGAEPAQQARDASEPDARSVQTPRDAASADASEPRDAAPEPQPALDASEPDAGRDAGPDASDVKPDAGSTPLPFTPAFQIPLRVHRGDSGLSGSALASVLEEVNQIWWKQAAICFAIEIVRDDAPRRDGFDLWFHRSRLGCNTTANGVYCGDHDVHSLDAPSLGRADDAAWNVRQLPARTAAHELGHGLNLQHYNGFADSNDSLMSSGRQGFKLHDSEIETARRRAQSKASADSPETPCAAVPVVD